MCTTRRSDRYAPSVPPLGEFRFAMPLPVRITGRSSSITNSFVNGIIPVIRPTAEQIEQALAILGMDEVVLCTYCGDPATEWDHLRPLVSEQRPTGYISEIHNLVPACGKCNQSKGNKPWRDWMLGTAPRSPASRGVPDLEEKMSRIEDYEKWGSASRVDMADVAGAELWAAHWENHSAILELMRQAEGTARAIRRRIAEASAQIEPPIVADSSVAES